MSVTVRGLEAWPPSLRGMEVLATPTFLPDSRGLFPDALCSLCPQKPCSPSSTLPSCLSWFHLVSAPGNPTLQPETPRPHLSHPRAVAPSKSPPFSAHCGQLCLPWAVEIWTHPRPEPLTLQCPSSVCFTGGTGAVMGMPEKGVRGGRGQEKRPLSQRLLGRQHNKIIFGGAERQRETSGRVCGASPHLLLQPRNLVLKNNILRL